MTPPKPPRSSTVIVSRESRDRDVRTVKTPPAGQTVGPVTERALRLAEWNDDARTPVGADDLETMQFRIERAAGLAKTAVTDIATLREEVREDSARIHDRIDVMGEQMGKVRDVLGDVSGQLKVIVPYIQQQQAATVNLNVGIDAHAKKTEIDDRSHAKRWRKDVIAKVVGGIFGSAAFTGLLIAALSEHC